MKTIVIVKHTGEFVDEIETLETVKEYTCEDGEENSLLSRARLTAELYNRDREGDYQARMQA